MKHENGGAASHLEDYRRLFVALDAVPATPPTWVLQGLLQPGLNILFGPPKCYKTHLALHFAAAITLKKPVDKMHPAPLRAGTVIYFAPEQSASRLRFIYERDVLGRKMKDKQNLDFLLAKNPWEWTIDSENEDRDFVELINDLKPTMLVLDPLVHFHKVNENDPHLVRYIIPLKEAMLRYGGALLVIHHQRKGSPDKGEDQNPWEGMRGTSALWAAADGGIILQKLKTGSGAINIQTDFKDHEGRKWTWKPKLTRTEATNTWTWKPKRKEGS